MNKLVLGVAVGWLIVGFVPARAQYFPPPTTPYVRPPLFPYSGGASPYGASPFGGGLFGTSPYGMGPYGASPYGTMPYGTTPYNAVPYGTGPFGVVPGVPAAPTTAVGLNDPNITGHPTRFFNYSRYFFNQGGAASALLPGTRPILGANPASTVTPVFGAAPPRGKANTGTGK